MLLSVVDESWRKKIQLVSNAAKDKQRMMLVDRPMQLGIDLNQAFTNQDHKIEFRVCSAIIREGFAALIVYESISRKKRNCFGDSPSFRETERFYPHIA
jgi:hypothetical protein